MQNLKLETNADGFAILTLDAAGQTMNVVNDAFLADMEEATAKIAADDSIKGVILTSGKPAFMAGADLTQLVQGFGTLTKAQAFAFSQRATAMHRAIEQSGKPWVAAINGLALGGGFELALACHHRVLVDNPKALVGLPEVNVGLLPGSGGTVRLALLVGYKKALDLLLSGRSVGPAEALKLGIVDEVVPADKLIDTARAWLATGPDPVRPWDVKGWVPPQKKGLTVPEDSVAYMMAAGAIALDIRAPDEHRVDHIANSLHVSRGKLEMNIEEAIPDLDATILCYCNAYNRGALSTDTLRAMGYRNVKLIAGGLRAYRALG